MEKEEHAKRTKSGVEAVALDGRARSHRIRFGWENCDGDHIQIKGDRRPLRQNATEQRLLKRIQGLYYGEGLGVRRIANRLNDSGRLNPRTGKPWSPTTIAAILKTAERWAAILEK